MNRATVLALFVGFLSGAGVAYAQTRAELRFPITLVTLDHVDLQIDKHRELDGGVTVDGFHYEASATLPSTVAGEPDDRCSVSAPLSGAAATCFRTCATTHVLPTMRTRCNTN